MKSRIYPKLAVSGISKNRRTYFPYLLTCIFMVMICYLLNYLTESAQITAMKGGAILQEMLHYGNGVFNVFAVIFLFYTNSFLIRSRKREFGLYNVLGMGKKNLARILVWEAVFVSLLSLAGGLFCGVLFSKAAELAIAHVMKSEVSMVFSIGTSALGKTAFLFAGIFGLILLHALVQVGRSKPIDLLHSTSVGEKPPKANWILAVIGILILAGAYFIAVRIEDPLSAFLMFFVAVAMVIVATYLLFIAGSVTLCHVLKKKKSYYYRADHFVSVSSMMYRMKRNGAGLASICVLSTMVLVMISAVTCMYIGNEGRLQDRYPQEISLFEHSFKENDVRQVQAAVQAAADKYGAKVENIQTYRGLNNGGLFDKDQVTVTMEKLGRGIGAADYEKIRGIYFVPIEDYNRITGSQETVADGEAILYCPRRGYEYDTITIGDTGTWKITKKVDGFVKNGEDMVVNTVYLFISDIEKTETALKEADDAFDEITNYTFDTNADEAVQEQIAQELQSSFEKLRTDNPDFPTVILECRAEQKAQFYALYSGLFVLGILLGIVFLAATVLIMYYKQVTEGYEDEAKFDIMQKVGMTKKEIQKSIRSQMFTVFLAPLLLAGVHTAFAFPIVQKLLILFQVFDTKLLAVTTIVCFLVFALFYTVVYFATSRAYYRIVSEK